jgi:hypothetical protein
LVRVQHEWQWDYATDTLTISADSAVQATFDTDGLSLASGQTVNNISDDGTLLADSTSSLVTERAIKYYVDNNAGGGGTSFTHYQDSSASTWIIQHNLGKQYVLVQVSDENDEVLIPDSITFTSANTTTVTFTTERIGQAVVSIGGSVPVTAGAFVHTQDTTSTTWVITHNLGSQFVNVEVADENDYAIIPDEISFDSENQLTITFLQEETGHAAITSGGVSVTGGMQDWITVTSAMTLSNGNRLLVDTNSSAITLTLPSTPSVGHEFWIVDASINFGTNNCTLSRNGSNIEGIADDYVLNVDRADVHLVYVGSTIGWRVIS